MKDLAYNKRARFDYEVLETFEAGISLLGTEVKSVRAGNMSLKGAFVAMHNDEALLTNATIPAWQVKNAPESYDPVRSRVLLLKRTELDRIAGAKREKGLTLVPIRVYIKGAYIKVEVALARGKKVHDKKQKKKEADIKRDTERLLRGKE